MTELTQASDQGAISVAKNLGGLAILAALIATLAGVVLLIVNPDNGSTLEGFLGLTAAVAGLSTAVFAVAALIYAQVRNLWPYAPSWVRVTAWALLAVAALISVIRTITQTS